MISLYHVSDTHSPYETLALEEAMFRHIEPNQIILYFYTHSPSVILGRTQNAWTEVDYEKLKADGGILARRITGGGAVYHDPENLNFSFITAPGLYSAADQTQILSDALQTFGIAVVSTGRNDLWANGRKFSGNAYCYRPQGTLHHGTILIDTNLERMQKYLYVPKGKLQAKGVKSVRSEVVNLRSICPELSNSQLIETILDSFGRIYGTPVPYRITPEVQQEAVALAHRNCTWDWIFGKTPGGTAKISGTFPWGRIQVRWSLAKGRLHDVEVYSDALQEGIILQIAPRLENTKFTKDALEQSLRTIDDSVIKKDVLGLLLQALP